MSQIEYTSSGSFPNAFRHSVFVSTTSEEGEYVCLNLDDLEHQGLFNDLDVAKSTADAISLAHDIDFLRNCLLERDSVLAASSKNCLIKGENGFDLVAGGMVKHQANIQVDDLLNRVASGEHHRNLLLAFDRLLETDVMRGRPISLVFSVDLFSDDENKESIQNYVCGFEYDSTKSEITSIDIRQFKNDYMLDREGGTVIRRLFDVQDSPLHEVCITDDEDWENWEPVFERMPLLREHLQRTATPLGQGYVFEGGPVLEHLAKTTPWLVETSSQGVPLPLRVVRVSEGESASLEGMRADSEQMALVYLQDHLHAHAMLTQRKKPVPVSRAPEQAPGPAPVSWRGI